MTAVSQRSLEPSGIATGLVLPEIVLEVSYETVAMVLGSTWDGFPGHHDPNYARSQGQQDIYLNTFALCGFLDRIALDWAGPDWFVRRRSMRMLASVYPGDTLIGKGTVTAVGALDDGTPKVDLQLSAGTAQADVCVTAETMITLPPDPGGPA